MQWKERLNVEISETGEKQRLFFVKIGKRLRFLCIWAYFEAGKRVYHVFACIIQRKVRLIVEIYQMGEK